MIKKYNKKRDFNKTNEPLGKISKSKKQLVFVVQNHHASNHHFDFRLEMNGVLKSWAIPKGPSLNPSDKRLAVEVEDHPMEYRKFEGNIPKGQYGGGTVMIWDEGKWTPKEVKDNIIKFTLEGTRLKGDWELIKMKENNWLLIKINDKFSEKNVGIDKYVTSIKTGRTMEEIAKGEHERKPSGRGIISPIN